MMSSKTYLSLMVLLFLAGCKLEEPAAPVAKFNVTGANCTGPCTVTFTDASQNTSVYDWTYSWDFGDGEKSAAKSPAHLYTNGGNYTVKLTLTGKYGTASDTAMVVIKGKPAEKPVAKFTVTGGNCEAPCEVSFTNASENAVTFIWNFGDNSADSVSTDANPKHIFKTMGTFIVRLTATGAGGTDSKTDALVIKAALPLLASFSFVKDTTTADFTKVTFTNKSTGAAKYDWEFGDTETSKERDPSHNYKRFADKDSSYIVKLKATASGGTTMTKVDTLVIKKR